MLAAAAFAITAQDSAWIGMIVKVDGEWEVLGPFGATKAQPYIPLRPGTKLRLLGGPRATGFLKASFRTGAAIEICCDPNRACERRSDCSSAIEIVPPPPERFWSLFELVSEVIKGKPDDYLATVRGGRGGRDEPQLKDGIVAVGEAVNLETLIRPPANSTTPLLVEIRRIGADGPGKPTTGAPIPIRFEGESALIDTRLSPGLYRFEFFVPQGDTARLLQTNIWVLLAPSERVETLRRQWTDQIAQTAGADESLTGILSRAFLAKLAAGEPRP